MSADAGTRNLSAKVFFLSEILGDKVICGGKRIGTLADVVITESGRLPEVTHFYVSRPFGDAPLLIPCSRISSITTQTAEVDADDCKPFEAPPTQGMFFLKDYVLDKKVLDMEDREVEVVYDVRLEMRNEKFYVTGVDMSRYGLLRRIGLKGIANFLHNLAFIVGARSLYSERLKGLANFIYGLARKFKDQTIPWIYVQPLPKEIGSFEGDVKLKVLKEKLDDIPPVDLADILEELPDDQRVIIFDKLDAAHAADTLEEIDPSIQRSLISSLKKEKAAELINLMTPGQAADLLSVLSFSEAHAIVKFLRKDHALKVRSILEQQEQRILDFAAFNFLKFPPERTAMDVLKEYPRVAKDKEAIMYVYIVDPFGKLLGVVDIRQLLLAEGNVTLKELMKDQVIHLSRESTLKQAAGMFARYGFRALPIIDENERMLGVVPYRDVMNLKHRFME